MLSLLCLPWKMLRLIAPRKARRSLLGNNYFDWSPHKGTFLRTFTMEAHGQTDFVMVQSRSSKGSPKPHRITPTLYWLYLSRMIMEILSPEACFRTLCALSELHPAQFSPLICRTWSPNRRPARDAGEFAWTNWTNIPCRREKREALP